MYAQRIGKVCKGKSRKYEHVLEDGTVECRHCTKCLPGQGVRQLCDITQDTRCEPCLIGRSFSVGVSSYSPCRECTVCPRNTLQRRPCSLTRNTKCGSCRKGFYMNLYRMSCEKCDKCFVGHSLVPEACNITAIPLDNQCVHVDMSVNQIFALNEDNFGTTSDPNQNVSSIQGNEDKFPYVYYGLCGMVGLIVGVILVGVVCVLWISFNGRVGF